MNREFLFKGKHVHALPQNKHLNGRWIEGYLSDKNHINSPELGGEFLVDESTVCQYTGLTDKNGRKIFEGDICEFSAYGDNYKGDVRFIKGNFTIWCGKCAPFLDDALEKHSSVVIGNIFDNPELLKGAEEVVE